MNHMGSILSVLVWSAVLTTHVDAGDVGAKQADPQEEVIVTARREKLGELTHDVAKAEDSFFDAYNHINTIRDFDIHCSVETALGTHISKRECRPRFVDKAREEEGANILDSILSNSGLGNGGATQPVRGLGANELINDKMRDYKDHLLAVVSSDQSLRKMLQKYKAIRTQYDAALKDETRIKIR